MEVGVFLSMSSFGLKAAEEGLERVSYLRPPIPGPHLKPPSQAPTSDELESGPINSSGLF